jgi:hypothetical protein
MAKKRETAFSTSFIHPNCESEFGRSLVTPIETLIRPPQSLHLGA